MPKCPNCSFNITNPAKDWNYGRFKVELFRCTQCGNQFREYSREGKVRFVLSAHNGSLGPKTKVKK